MKILITSGLRSKDVGGPAQYGPNLKQGFEKLGHRTNLISYSSVEKALPIGLRHLYFFFRIFPSCIWADRVISLDTFSSGVPTVLATKICRTKSIVRVGGDFLWESFVNRTGEKIILPEFYEAQRNFNLKEKIIFSLTDFLIKNSTILAFNTEWQKDIWLKTYKISENKVRIIRNFMPNKEEGANPLSKNFVWAGRDSRVKNLDVLKKVSVEIKSKNPEFSLDILTNFPHEKLVEKIKSCYAVILPSLSDVSPNFILEGISFGKPFIVTKYSGIGEICPKGGMFVDPLDEEDIKKAIETVLDSEGYNRLVNEISQQGLEARPWSVVATDFLNI
jgi:glycosyltransferase involved in cell wall biosynthesis